MYCKSVLSTIHTHLQIDKVIKAYLYFIYVTKNNQVIVCLIDGLYIKVQYEPIFPDIKDTL